MNKTTTALLMSRLKALQADLTYNLSEAKDYRKLASICAEKAKHNKAEIADIKEVLDATTE